MKRIQVLAIFPTLLTLGNAVCGFTAILLANQATGDKPEPLFYAGLLIFGAMLFDMLDGSIARLTNQASDFGQQLDSLCDVVSFGVAPAFIMLKLTDRFPARMMVCLAVFYVLCAILRLARFNVESHPDDGHSSFRGLPSPAAGGTIASLAIAMPGLFDLTTVERAEPFRDVIDHLIAAVQNCVPLLTVMLALLMVSRLRYSHVFNQLLRGKTPLPGIVQLLFALIAILSIHELAVPLIFLCFAFAAPARVLMALLLGQQNRAATLPPEQTTAVP